MNVHKWIASKVQELGLSIRGVIHIGAHWGEEKRAYEEIKIYRQVWIEPIPENFRTLCHTVALNRPGVHAFQLACGSMPSRSKMVISHSIRAETHSLAKLKRQLEVHPEHKQVGEVEVEVVRLDDLLEKEGIRAEDFNLIVFDTQGTELDAMMGAQKTIAQMDCVVSEVGTLELYENMALEGQIDAWLKERGFKRMDTHWFGPKFEGNQTYGDAFYLRTPADGK